MPGGCVILTERQAATLHMSAIVNYLGAIKMASALGGFPAIARRFYDEVADWRNLGEQIEANNPGLTPYDWRKHAEGM